MLLTDTIPQQPYFAYVELLINGEDILYSSEEATKCLLSFRCEKISETMANNWEFSLFDQDWDYLETKIAASHQRILMRYGYYEQRGHNLSPWFTGQVTNVVPSIEIDGTILTVSGMSDIYKLSDKQNHEKRFRTWGGEGYRISDIVKEICYNNNWYLKEYVETSRVYEVDDQFKTDPTDKIFFQSGMADLPFIKNVLTPMAVTEDGVAGFRFWFDDAEQAKTGYPVCYFKPYEDWSADPVKTYLYMRNHLGYGEVLSWQPDLSQRWPALISGYNSAMSSVDIYTKKNHMSRALLEAPAKILGSEGAESYTQEIVTGHATLAGDFNTRVGLNRFTQAVLAITSQDNVNPHCNKAELEVIGDPQRKPDENILVICTTNDNRLHYSSGLYKILKIEDNIDSSGYRSLFTLIRCVDVTRSFEEYEKP